MEPRAQDWVGDVKAFFLIKKKKTPAKRTLCSNKWKNKIQFCAGFSAESQFEKANWTSADENGGVKVVKVFTHNVFQDVEQHR